MIHLLPYRFHNQILTTVYNPADDLRECILSVTNMVIPAVNNIEVWNEDDYVMMLIHVIKREESEANQLPYLPGIIPNIEKALAKYERNLEYQDMFVFTDKETMEDYEDLYADES